VVTDRLSPSNLGPERLDAAPEPVGVTLARRGLSLAGRRTRGLHPISLRLAVEGLSLLGAAVLVGSATIHLDLWAGSYGSIPTVGLLFLFQGIAGLVFALALAVLRRAGLMALCALFMVSTAGGLLFSHWFGLFGYKENLAVPYAGMSLVLEFGGAAILLVACALTLRAGPSNSAA